MKTGRETDNRQTGRRIARGLALLVMVGGMMTGGCQQPTTTDDKANSERWSKFQEANKQDQAVGQSAYEKRQAELAAKKAGGTSTPAPPPGPAPAAPTKP